jgi:hypothetical protein
LGWKRCFKKQSFCGKFLTQSEKFALLNVKYTQR